MRGLRSGRAHTLFLRAAFGLLLITSVVLVGTPADAASEYRYWGFFHWGNGSWAMAQKGPAQVVPEDGSVDGWHFAIAGKQPRPPRAAGDFELLCGDTPAQSGRKRVAVVLDYGIDKEAPDGQTPPKPRGECAVVAPGASSAAVLAAVAPVRQEKGLICAIDKYPQTGCGEQVQDPPKVKLPEPGVDLVLPAGTAASRGLPIWGVTVVALVVIIALGGLLTRRRSSRKDADGDAPPPAESGT